MVPFHDFYVFWVNVKILFMDFNIQITNLTKPVKGKNNEFQTKSFSRWSTNHSISKRVSYLQTISNVEKMASKLLG